VSRDGKNGWLSSEDRTSSQTVINTVGFVMCLASQVSSTCMIKQTLTGGCSFLYSLAGKALHMAHVLLGSAVGPHTHLGVAKARTVAFIALMRPCIHFAWLVITLLSTLFLCVCSCEAELTPGCGLCCCKADAWCKVWHSPLISLYFWQRPLASEVPYHSVPRPNPYSPGLLR